MTHEQKVQKLEKEIKHLRKALKSVIEILEANHLCEPGAVTLSEIGGGGGEE